VEFSLLTNKDAPDPASDPAIPTFIHAAEHGRGRIVWPQAGPVASLEGPDTEAIVTEADLPATGTQEFKGLRVVLTGRYVSAYFDDEARVTLVRFALALAEALRSEYSALYARCAAGRAHHLGSLFRGPTPGAPSHPFSFHRRVRGRRTSGDPSFRPEATADRLAFRNIARADHR
jgi:hypothetical protein